MLHPAYDLTFYEFDDERDTKVWDVMLCDLVHGKPPLKPLYLGTGWYWYVYAIIECRRDPPTAHHERLGL